MNTENRSGCVIISMLASSAANCGFEPRPGQTKTVKLVPIASPLNTQQKWERAKIGWLGVRIMCPSVARCIRGLLFK